MGDKEIIKAAMVTSPAGHGAEFVPEELANTYIDLIREKNYIRGLARSFNMNSSVVNIPKILSGADVVAVSENQPISAVNVNTGQVSLNAIKLGTAVAITNELIEDSNQNMEAILKEIIGKSMAAAEEKLMLNGDTVNQAADPLLKAADGLVALSENAAVDFSGGAATNKKADLSLYYMVFENLGLYANDHNAVTVILNSTAANSLLTDVPELVTVNLYGNKATLITGEIGSPFGVRTFGTSTLASGTAVATIADNMIVGDRRKIKIVPKDAPEVDGIILYVTERIAFNVEQGKAIVNLNYIV